MKKYIYILLIIELFYPSNLKASDSTLHLTTAYALQTFLYGISKKGLRLNTKDATIFSAFTVAMTGITWEYLGRTPISGNDLLHNTLGQSLSIGTVLMFDW